MTEHPAAPMTEAGRRLLNRRSYWSGNTEIRDGILAIEDQARAAARKEVLDDIDDALPVAYGDDQANYKSEVSAILDSLSTDTRKEPQPIGKPPHSGPPYNDEGIPM